MKKKEKLRLQNTDRRKPIKYADIDTEDFYGEDIESEQEEQFDTDDDEYIVAYSSEDKTVGTYRQEEMQEYADEYASELENEEYEPEEYDEPEEYESEEYQSEEYEEVEEYEETEEYESEEYEESDEYEETEEYESEEYEESDGYEETEEYESEEYEESDEYESEEYEETKEYESEEYEEFGEYEPEEYEELEKYEETEEYETEEYESEAYEESDEYAAEEYETEEYASEEYEETEEYESEEYEDIGEYLLESEAYKTEAPELQYNTKEINIDLYEAEDYAEDTESYYEHSEEEYYDEDTYEESDAYYDDEDSFDTAFGEYNDSYENDIAAFDLGEELSFWQRVKLRMQHLTIFDAVLACTGVVVLVAAVVILSMFIQSNQLDKQIEALAPLGDELKNLGVVGDDGLLAMSNAALSGMFTEEETSLEEISSIEVVAEPETAKVNVSFVSVEKDLKIRFTDANTGELITGTVFEVTLTNAKGKQLVLKDEDMDGIIYAQNITAGVFDAIVTSTEKYKFPAMAQHVTVKDKVEYVVINVQDEVKTEKQINVVAEDTQKNDAETEAEVLKDTVEWVESTKTPVSGSESYLLVDKNTIADPSQVSRLAARMLFDTLNVSLDQSEATLTAGAVLTLKGTEFTDTKEEDIEYQYTTEWKSSDESVASVSNGKVTAKAEGTAVITYTVTKKTITTTYEPKETVEETLEIMLEDYQELPDKEKEKCTPIKDDADQTIGYIYQKVTEPQKKTSETTESASAECKITVEAVKIASGSLEIVKSADSCAVGETVTVKPSKLVYTKQDGSTETITENFPVITWDSGDASIAAVDSKGVVTGIQEGKVQITGTVSGIQGADGKELKINSSVEIHIIGGKELSISLDRTKDVNLAVGGTTTLVATVSNSKEDAGVTWESSDVNVATVDEKGVVTAIAAGSVTITAITKEQGADGNSLKATCVVTVNSNVEVDTTTKLKDKNGNQIYIKNADGSYREAVYADYFSSEEFYITSQPQYIYTGWQTIDGKTYYFDKTGNVVTGTQIIQGVTYNFGTDGAIATSVNGSTFGIDVSRHNGTIDWNAVKASGVDYVIIRCGYRGSATGVLIEDQSFRTNIKGATAAGLKVGVYVFSQAINEVEAVKEASLAVSLVKGYNLTYPIFIDTESSGGRADKIDRATRTAVVNAFCQTVASAGYKPGIYASKTWFEDKLNMGAIGNYKIWLAQYSTAPTYSGRYDMWQYSCKGKISGISTKVDLNYSYLGY